MKCDILTVDVPTFGGYVFKRSEIEKVIAESNDRDLLGCFQATEIDKTNLCDVSHSITDLRFEGDTLVGTVKILQTPKGQLLSENINNIKFSAVGYGNIENSIITNYKLLRVDAVLK